MIELTRDCGLEGIKRITCTGKQDNIDLLKRELMCLSERENENTGENEKTRTTDEGQVKTSAADIVSSTTTPFINVHEPIPDQIEKPIEKLFNGDIPIAPVTEAYTPHKPLKPMKKIASEKPLKNQPKLLKKYKLMLNKNMDDMMMGDQPVQYIPKIEDILPHTKKALKVDESEHTNELAKTITSHQQRSSTELPTTKQEIVSSDSNTRSRRNSDVSSTPVLASSTEPTIGIISTESIIITTESITNVSIESITDKNVDVATVGHNSTQSASDHFVPPMLLVHHEDLSVKVMPKEGSTVSTTVLSITEEAVTATTTPIPGTPSSSAATEITATETSAAPTTTESNVQSSSSQATPASKTSQPTTAPELASSTTTVSTPTTTEAPATEPSTTTTVSTTTAHVHTTPQVQQKANAMMRPHAPKHAGEIHYHASNIPVEATNKADTVAAKVESAKTDASHMPARNPNFIAEISNDIHDNKTAQLAISTNSVDLSPSTLVPHGHGNANGHEYDESHIEPGSGDDSQKRRADFTNSDVDYKPYKPNRRRVLTKADGHSYIQRVFGRR